MFVFIDSDSWDLIVRDSASVMHESRKESSIKKNCHKLFSKKTDFKFQVYKKDRSQLRDGPLEKLWGGEGNFRAAGIFFRYQIPCMNFFQALHEYFLGLIGLQEFFFI